MKGRLRQLDCLDAYSCVKLCPKLRGQVRLTTNWLIDLMCFKTAIKCQSRP